MGRIDEAIACFNLRKKGASFLYREVAREFKVDRSTLLQCHQRKTLSNAEEAQQRSHLTSQQEQELVNNTQGLTEHRLSPTRSMIQNLASVVAKVDVSACWVMRFFARNPHHLTSKWTIGIDCNCHKAESKERYCQYFL
jgi:hypothetical protein